MTGPTLVVVGDALLDRDVHGSIERVAPDAPVPVLDEHGAVVRAGGAALAASLAAGRHDVVFLTALADDEAGAEVRRLLGDLGVEVVALPAGGATPEKVRFRAGSHPLLRLDRGGLEAPTAPLSDRLSDLLARAGSVLVSDYGRGMAAHPGVRAAVADRRMPTVWDPHPRGPVPVPGVTVVTPNRAELRAAVAGIMPTVGTGPAWPGDDLRELTALARTALGHWSVGAVAATLGADGALLVAGTGAPLVAPVTPVDGDTCGAGDAFAAAVASAILGGAMLTEAVTAAVEGAGRFVAAGGAATMSSPVASGPRPVPPANAGPTCEGGADGLSAGIRAAGGRVVVAGGCFDLLHAGHISLLAGARRLGDCLIVAVNSDESVRRLKGAGRPVVSEADRVAMLRALGCVDDVIVFGEDSPVTALRRLRPHVFAKGGDYSARQLPEETVLAEWGGQVVVLPYLSGRSTTGLLEVAGGRT